MSFVDFFNLGSCYVQRGKPNYLTFNFLLANAVAAQTQTAHPLHCLKLDGPFPTGPSPTGRILVYLIYYKEIYSYVFVCLCVRVFVCTSQNSKRCRMLGKRAFELKFSQRTCNSHLQTNSLKPKFFARRLFFNSRDQFLVINTKDFSVQNFKISNALIFAGNDHTACRNRFFFKNT